MYEFTALFAYKLLFLFELFIAEFIYMFRLKRRKKFCLRLGLGASACFLIAFLFPIIAYDALYSSFMFLFIFAMTLIMLKLCFDEPLLNVVFCGIAAYTTRHLAFQFYSLVSTAGNSAVSAIFSRDPANSLNDFYGSSLVNADIFGQGTLFWALIYVAIYIASYSSLFAIFGSALWKNNDLKINNRSFLVLVGIVLLIDILLNAILVYIPNGYNAIYAAVTYVFNILCCILTLYMQFSMINVKKLKKELSLISHMWQQEREQYEISKENIDLINLKCHDLKHQIRKIGRHQSMNDKFISEIEKVISIYDSAVKTGNDALDVILTEKSLVCRKNSISLTCIADGASLKFIDEADIYSLFGNVVDNAMEAVRKLSDEEHRVIGLSVHESGNMIAANVNNYYEGDIILDKDGFPLTTKRNKDLHGYGMRSARMLVEKYGGDMTVTAKQGVFNVNIIFPTVKKEA